MGNLRSLPNVLAGVADHVTSESSSSFHNLFRRCVKCPDTAPICPKCAKDETCSLIAQSCTQCASTSCIKTGTLGDPAPSGHKTPTGAIAGGVIGGVAVIFVLVFLLWRFFIRNRRQQWDEQLSEIDAAEKRNTLASRREARQSTRSVASTTMTRASNVIQIAYIPGVTNRSPPNTPGLLVPPVPPLPFASRDSSAASTPNYAQDQHFFLPGDIRDSTWSGLSDDQASISPSMARSSVATTIYRNNAIVSPHPAQQALRGKAAVVSVKSGSTSEAASPTSSTRSQMPPMPIRQLSRPGASTLTNTSNPIVARAGSARPVQVNNSPNGSKVPTLSSNPSISPLSTIKVQTPPRVNLLGTMKHPAELSASSESETDEESSRRSLMGNNRSDGHTSAAVTMIEDSPAARQGPFASGVSPTDTARGASANSLHRHKKSGSLNNLIEEAMSRASRAPTHGGLGSAPEQVQRDPSPFSDDNEVK